MRGKTQKLKVQAIQKEQYQLAQVENIVTKLLAKVNESINELKVEELHIKSNLVEHYTNNFNDDQPTTSAQAALRLNATSLVQENSINIQPTNSSIDMEGIENINKQMLALESLLVPLKRKNYDEVEEEEDDDDDDDDNEDEDYEYFNTENEESENEE